jgi:glycosyltransferase involved in cell wall biosynthesis
MVISDGRRVMKKLTIDARSISANMDGLGYYSLFFVRRVCRYLRDYCDISIILPPSMNNTRLLGLPDSRNINIVFSNQERVGRNYTFDSEEWDCFISSLKPDIYISTAFCSVKYDCVKVVFIPDIMPVTASHLFSFEKVSLYSKLFSQAIQGSDLILAASNYTASDIETNFPEAQARIKVLYPDIAETINRIINNSIGINPNHDRFLVIGLKSPHKNVGVVIEALRILKERNINQCRVYFIGNVKEHDVPIQELIDRFALSDIATVLGYVSDQELSSLMLGSKGLLFPSLYEGFGMPLLEFASINKPIICMKNSSIYEVLGDLGLYVNNDAYEFANKMLAVYYSHNALLDQPLVDERIARLRDANMIQYNDLFMWIEEKLGITLRPLEGNQLQVMSK